MSSTIDMPMCAVCKRPVEKFYTYRDQMMYESVYVAECHGEVEKATLSDQVQACSNNISIGVAFAQLKLPEVK